MISIVTMIIWIVMITAQFNRISSSYIPCNSVADVGLLRRLPIWWPWQNHQNLGPVVPSPILCTDCLGMKLSRYMVSHDGVIMMTSSNGSIFHATDVFFDLRLNERLSKPSWGWWFDTLSRPLWRHCNDITWWRHERFWHYWPFMVPKMFLMDY